MERWCPSIHLNGNQQLFILVASKADLDAEACEAVNVGGLSPAIFKPVFGVIHQFRRQPLAGCSSWALYKSSGINNAVVCDVCGPLLVNENIALGKKLR